MLRKKDLVDELGNEYKPMINEVDIADFQKCIAQYAGLRFESVPDDVIKEYLVTWAKNKKYIYDLFGSLKVDIPFMFLNPIDDKENDLIDLGLRNPAFFSWLYIFRRTKHNKIQTFGLNCDVEHMLRMLCNENIEGMSLTRFFKSKLNAPDELVTEIGRLWENQEVQATFTMSIDPVDIMLSSENPYKWTSCYRLEEFNESHADGCLAGVLDKSTIITYVWNREGKFSLYDKFEFKNIRYKRMRMTIAVNEKFNAIHFNEIYPGKSELSPEFHKKMRDVVETYFSNKLNKTNMWIRGGATEQLLDPYRIHNEYGYGEYNFGNVYVLKGEEDYPRFNVYSETITCPCGCGQDYIGTDNADYYEYNGDGHITENYDEDDTSWDLYQILDSNYNIIEEYDWERDARQAFDDNDDAMYLRRSWGDNWDSEDEIILSREVPDEEDNYEERVLATVG